MTTNKDWRPASRDGLITMGRDWITLLGATGGKAAAWGVPAAALTDLGSAWAAAQAALDTARNETTRTPVATAQCKTAFEALTEKMRDMKRRYFLTPPLVDADYVSLGLKPHDTTPTPSGVPTAQTTIETYLVGRHELGIKIVYVTGNPHDGANKGGKKTASMLFLCLEVLAKPKLHLKQTYTAVHGGKQYRGNS
jgi:hypothetical protein